MKKHLIQFLMVCVLSVLSTSAWAQTTVKGIVVDAETTEPLIGAAVMEDGTTNGTATDIDGAFELTVSRSGSLTLKYVGYKDLTLKISRTGSVVDLGTIAMECCHYFFSCRCPQDSCCHVSGAYPLYRGKAGFSGIP